MTNKIIFFLPFIKMGGLERVAVKYIKQLADDGKKIHVLIEYDLGDDNVLLSELPSNVTYSFVKSFYVSRLVYDVRSLGKKNKIFNLLLVLLIVISDLFYLSRTRKFVVSLKFDELIYFYQFMPTYLTTIKTMRHTLWMHGAISHFFGSFKSLFLKLYAKRLKCFDRIVVISREMKEQLSLYYNGKFDGICDLIYNPFSVNVVNEKIHDTSECSEVELALLNLRYIVSVCRLDENQKDVICLIKSFKNICCYDKQLNLIIIGDGPDLELIKKLVCDLNLSNCVHLLGRKMNPFVWINKAEVFVLSSKYEGFPTVLLEAIACKTLVVASDCKTGPNEILDYGELGYLFPVGDIDELTKMLLKGIEKSESNNQMISKAYSSLHSYSFDRSISQLLRK